MKKRIYWELFSTFFKIGLFTFGGGYAMLPILQRELVDNKGWATQEELAAYCRFANGAGSICATHRGGIPALKGEEEIKACMEQYPLLETGFSLN